MLEEEERARRRARTNNIFWDEDFDDTILISTSCDYPRLSQAELFSIWDYLEFIGLTVYWILIELWSYNANSYFVTCSNSWSSLTATIKLFVSYLNVPFPTAFQEESFALVSVLEYPYPISVFCYSAVFEVYYDSLARAKIFVK